MGPSSPAQTPSSVHKVCHTTEGSGETEREPGGGKTGGAAGRATYDGPYDGPCDGPSDGPCGGLS